MFVGAWHVWCQHLDWEHRGIPRHRAIVDPDKRAEWDVGTFIEAGALHDHNVFRWAHAQQVSFDWDSAERQAEELATCRSKGQALAG